MNELPELDELVQVGLFNILEETRCSDSRLSHSLRPRHFHSLFCQSEHLQSQWKSDSAIEGSYRFADSDALSARTRAGIEILQQEANVELDGQYPVLVPYFMAEIIEEITIQARKSKYIDQASGVSARFSLSNYRAMIGSARQRAIVLGESPAVPRISDLGHLISSSLGKLELDLMGSHQMNERQCSKLLWLRRSSRCLRSTSKILD